jgi:hypothetical protein
MADVAGFSPQNAKLILDVVRYLRANGLIGPSSDRGQQRFPPQAPIYVRNDSGAEITAFACLQTTGTAEAGGQNYITVDQPVDTTGAAGAYLFNGQQPIEIGGYGIAHDGPLCRMLKTGTLTSGDKAQPVVGQWHIAAGGDLITIVGADDIGTNIVRGVIGSSGGGEDWGVIIKTPVGGIAARSSTTVYSASCDVFSIVGSTLTDTTENIDVFNISLGSVNGEIFGTAKREYATGKWIIDLEDCT